MKPICSCCAEQPKLIDWPARIRAPGERAVRDCAAGKHWLGLNADLTPATSCAWGFCGYGNEERVMPFVIGIEYTKTESNVGTLMRSAVNFGAAMVFTVGRRYRRQASDTMHAAHQIPVLHFASWEEAQKHLPSEWTPIAVELGEGAHRLESFVHPKRAIYVLGPEDGSVSDEAQRWCKSKVVIPSLRCLNVAVAGSIVMYDRIAKAA